MSHTLSLVGQSGMCMYQSSVSCSPRMDCESSNVLLSRKTVLRWHRPRPLVSSEHWPLLWYRVPWPHTSLMHPLSHSLSTNPPSRGPSTSLVFRRSLSLSPPPHTSLHTMPPVRVCVCTCVNHCGCNVFVNLWTCVQYIHTYMLILHCAIFCLRSCGHIYDKRTDQSH